MGSGFLKDPSPSILKQSLHKVLHTLVMGALPVDSSAVGAAVKYRMGFPNLGRQLIDNGFFGDVFQHRIADQTTPERTGLVFESEARGYFFELELGVGMAHVIAVVDQTAHEQASIAG